MQKAVTEQPERIPTPALLLGLGGLVPFVALPFAAAFSETLNLPPQVRAHATVPALTLYAAVILSFMGGVRWGLAMRQVAPNGFVAWRRYTVSILPALLAWTALFLGTRAGLVTLAAGSALLLIYDLWSIRRGEAPQWYERLRVWLTSVVVLSLTVTSAFIL